MSLINTAMAYRDAEKIYLKSSFGAEQRVLRYELRDAYVLLPANKIGSLTEKALQQNFTLMGNGTDLEIRVRKWENKRRHDNASIIPKRQHPSTIKELLAKTREYVDHYNTPEHKHALSQADSKQHILAFQQAVLNTYKSSLATFQSKPKSARLEAIEGLYQQMLRELKTNGFTEPTKENKRVFGRLENWTIEVKNASLEDLLTDNIAYFNNR